MRIVQVGCGFVGSIFVEEFLKRMFAGEFFHEFRFIDGDKWERRNAANQNVSLKVASDQRPKAETMAAAVKKYEREAEWHHTLLTAENADELLAGAHVLIDAVDNLGARTILYDYGMKINVPVLHIGIDPGGTGRVEWSHVTHDTFHLAPHRVYGKTIVDPESGVQPPCELAAMRGVGTNISFAAAKALAILMGFDPEYYIATDQHPGDSLGYMTDWSATTEGHKLIIETKKKLADWGQG